MGRGKSIGIRDVEALRAGAILWDTTLPGFGARRQKDAVAYILKYRAGKRQRWHTIGRHGAPWTPTTARKEALRLLGDIAQGGDPVAKKRAGRDAVTVAALCERYLEDAEAGRILVRGGRPKKEGTLSSDRGRIHGHIIPLLGSLPVAAVIKQDVEQFMHQVAAGEAARTRRTRPRGVSNVRGGRGVASRTIGLLGAIFTYAIDRGMRADNPAHQIRKFAENKRRRRLTDLEYAALGEALRGADCAIWPPAVACVRFLALTGWRSGEAVALRWQDVDLDRRTALLADTKTGESVRPLSDLACDVLCRAPRLGELVFPATRGDGLMAGFKKFARRVFALGKLPADVTPHVLRHSYASLAGDLGYSDPTIAALVGHKGRTITSRYLHAADAVLLAAADAVARRTGELMGEARTADVLPPRRA